MLSKIPADFAHDMPDERNPEAIAYFFLANAAFEDAIVLPLRKATYTVLSFDVKFITSGSISVRVFVASEKKMYTIHYVTEEYVLVVLLFCWLFLIRMPLVYYNAIFSHE